MPLNGGAHQSSGHQQGVHNDQDEEDSIDRQRLFKNLRLGLGGLAFIISILLGLALEFKWIGNMHNVIWTVNGILVIAYAFIGYPVLKAALKNLMRGHYFDENFLMSIATIGAIFLGEYAEAVGVMLFYLIGEHFQDQAVAKSRRAIQKLLAIRPDTATLVSFAGEEIQIDAHRVRVDDVLRVQIGQRVPCDGVVIEGSGYFDTSSVTGESKPRYMTKGDPVLGGFLAVNQKVDMRVLKPFEESTASRMIAMVQSATEKKAKAERFMTVFARYYTPAIMASALAVALIPPILLGQSFQDWLYKALIFLVISCPCALVISIPLGYFGGIGAASKNGILVKGGNYLDALANVKHIAFDKTGTLTKGEFEVRQVHTFDYIDKENLLALVSKVESDSPHPIARALVKANGTSLNRNENLVFKVDDHSIQEWPGQGVLAKVLLENSLEEIRIGKVDFVGGHVDTFHTWNAQAMMKWDQLKAKKMQLASTTVWVSLAGKIIGVIVVDDEIKESALSALNLLRKKGVDVSILSGDHGAVVKNMGSALGVEEALGDLSPQDKLNAVETLLLKASKGTKSDHTVAFVGDGLNDAPVLARADIGIAMGGLGTDVAIEAADIVLMNDDLELIAKGIDIAHRTKRIVYQNIVMAIGIKVAFLTLGLIGLSGMWEAIFADVGVALLAILNATRTSKIQERVRKNG